MPPPLQRLHQPNNLRGQTPIPHPNTRPNQPANHLTNRLPFRRVYYKTLQKGSLMYSQYLYWRHDPAPLVLVTDVLPDRIRGVNLHFLTFKYVKSLLNMNCGKAGFSYAAIKGDKFLTDAFRTYKKSGLRNIQLLDCDFIKTQFQEQRRAYKYNPQELKNIRETIQRQLSRAANPKAEDL